jgi:phosphoglycerate dehydrogenase-like enzyme
VGEPTHESFRVGVTRDVRRPDGSFAFAPFDLSPLDAAGISWDFLAEDARPLRRELLEGVDGVYHFSASLDAQSVEGVERLTIVARHGVGLDMVDLEACTTNGVAVTITPDGVTQPMASAAVTLVLALAHRLRERDLALHAGEWGPGRFEPMGRGLVGRTLGVIGYGRIGREVVRLLSPWGMRVLVTQRTEVREPGVTHVGLEQLLEASDVVVVACPLNDETRRLLDEARLRRMKAGAVLVNVARGAIVDQAALVEVLEDGHLAGAGLDVVDPEPPPADDPLLSAPNVLGAPHSLGYTDDLIRGCIESACASLLAVAAGRVPSHVANPAVLGSSVFQAKLARFGGGG